MESVPHFIIALLGFLLVMATLPLLLELAVLTVAAVFPSREDQPRASVPVRLAIIVPAHNEQELIVPCIDSLRGAAQIYVIAHNCSDSTADRAAAAGAQILPLDDSIGGKGIALDFGFRYALAQGADAVLVIDADSTVSSNLIPAVSAAFARGAEALQCRYQVANPGANHRTRLAALAFLGMDILRPLGRHRLGLSCGIFGNGFALSAATLQRVPYSPNSLVEDLEYHLHLIRAGVRVEFLNDAAVFGEMPETRTAAGSQRARWEGGRILMRRLWTRPLLAKVLRGRIALVEPLLDLLALPLATTSALLLLLFALGWAAHLPAYTGYALAGSITLCAYVLISAFLGPEPAGSLLALASAPAFLFWKLLMIPRIRLASRDGAEWVRTQRNAEVRPPEPPL